MLIYRLFLHINIIDRLSFYLSMRSIIIYKLIYFILFKILKLKNVKKISQCLISNLQELIIVINFVKIIKLKSRLINNLLVHLNCKLQ